MNIDNSKILNEMNIYANKYKLEYSNEDSYEVKEKDKIAKHIHNNIHKMNFNEKINYYKKFLTETKINKELLKFELCNYVPEKKINNFNQLIKTIEKLLKRYHNMAGGFLLEDNQWNLHLEGSYKYNLKKNEAIFDNSIKDDNTNSEETYNYIKQLVSLFSQLTDKYIVRFKYLPDRQEKIHWTVIKISQKKIKNKNNTKN